MIQENNVGRQCFFQIYIQSGPNQAQANVWQRGHVIHEQSHSYLVRYPNIFDGSKSILKEFPKKMVVIA